MIELEGFNTSKTFEPVRNEYQQAIQNETAAILCLQTDSPYEGGNPYPQFRTYLLQAGDHINRGNDALKNISPDLAPAHSLGGGGPGGNGGGGGVDTPTPATSGGYAA